MSRNHFGRFLSFSLSEHNSFMWLSMFAMGFIAVTTVWARHLERIKSILLN